MVTKGQALGPEEFRDGGLCCLGFGMKVIGKDYESSSQGHKGRDGGWSTGNTRRKQRAQEESKLFGVPAHCVLVSRRDSIAIFAPHPQEFAPDKFVFHSQKLLAP